MSIKKATDQEVKRRFGEKMRQLRKEKGLSQEKLGFAVEMDLTSINEIERGHRSPKLITMYKIAQALGISLTELTNF